MPGVVRLQTATPHERRLARRLDARGEKGLADALIRLRGTAFGGRYRIESLYAVGGEGAVYIARDELRPWRALVAKLPLLPVHEPFQLTSPAIRRQRETITTEAKLLALSRSPHLPRHVGTHTFHNPLLDAERGNAFAEPDPVYVMEKLPGSDLDRWLRRVHHTELPQAILRRTLDRVAVVLLQALVDLHERGFLYADLRPGNMRMIGHPHRRVRLLDAGSLVTVYDDSGRFPHVPAYLPPQVFDDLEAGRPIAVTAHSQAIMAGRTLYAVATGREPRPGLQVDTADLADSNVSPPVQDVIDGLCRGDFVSVRPALLYLSRRAKRRIVGGNTPEPREQAGPAASAETPPAAGDTPARGATAQPKTAPGDRARSADPTPTGAGRLSVWRRLWEQFVAGARTRE